MGKSNTVRIKFLSEDTGEKIYGLVGTISLSLIAIENGTPIYDKKIGEIKFIDDNDGVIDFNKFMESNLKLIQSFYFQYSKKYEIGFAITLVTEMSDQNKPFIEKMVIEPKWNEDITGFEGVDYSEKKSFYVGSINNKATDLKSLVMDFKSKELDYFHAKALLEAEVKNNIDIQLESINGYEPENFTKVITLILEFQRGTLEPAIEFTRVANMRKEHNNLNAINNIMNMTVNMYPKIDIKMGEGIPYNNK
jgi:hypothetical protein